MRCIWSTRDGVGAELIRRKEGGTSSHCAIMMADGWVLDSQPWAGVAVTQLGRWRETHRILAAYDVPLPNESRAIVWAIEQRGKRYDWLRNIGYVLWRELGSSPDRLNCEELVLGAWLQGGLTLSDRAPRPSVRMLREIAHACGAPVDLKVLG